MKRDPRELTTAILHRDTEDIEDQALEPKPNGIAELIKAMRCAILGLATGASPRQVATGLHNAVLKHEATHGAIR